MPGAPQAGGFHSRRRRRRAWRASCCPGALSPAEAADARPRRAAAVDDPALQLVPQNFGEAFLLRTRSSAVRSRSQWMASPSHSSTATISPRSPRKHSSMTGTPGQLYDCTGPRLLGVWRCDPRDFRAAEYGSPPSRSRSSPTGLPRPDFPGTRCSLVSYLFATVLDGRQLLPHQRWCATSARPPATRLRRLRPRNREDRHLELPMTTRHPGPTGRRQGLARDCFADGGDDLGGPDIMPQSGRRGIHGTGWDSAATFLTCGGRPQAFPRKRLVHAFTRCLIADLINLVDYLALCGVACRCSTKLTI